MNKDGDPTMVLCDIVPLQVAHAKGVKAGIDIALISKLEVNEETLTNKLVGCDFNGAAIMMGRKSGVATMYKELCPWAITIHCMASNLELAVLDVMKEVKELPCVKTGEDTIKTI